jgi:hypothetical protein
VTGSTLGSALVAAVVVAFVTIGGPGVAVAVADPGSHSSQSRDRDGRDGRNAQRDGSQRNGSGFRGSDRGTDSRRDDRNGKREEPRGSTTGRDPRASGSKNTYSKNTNSKNTSDDEPVFLVPEARPSVPSEQVTAPVAQDEPAVAVPEPEVGGGGGGGHVGATVSADPPRVVFGNGRTPGPSTERADAQILGADPVAPWAGPPTSAAVTAPPAAAPLAEAPTIFQRTMAPRLTPVDPASSVTSLWGLAGLILAPLAGILLGYRQARANKAAAELKSTLAR